MRSADKPRALFINSGILGHKSVVTLLREATAHDPELDAVHVDLSEGLTLQDRVARRLLCFRPFGETRLSRMNIDFARWRHEMHAGLLAARRIRAHERRGPRFDVLHFHTQAAAYCSLKRMEVTPTVVSIDCTGRLASLETRSRIARSTYWPNRLRDGEVFRRASAIISTSRWAARSVESEYPDCAQKIDILPYPVRLESFDPGWIEERRARFLQKPTSEVRVLFIGGDFLRKGGLDLLHAWREGRFADRAQLDLVTDWPLEKAGLGPGVHLLTGIAPFTREWSELWRQADLFVLPTRSEAFGMVYQEAAAAGLPAIGSRLNAVPEIIEDNVTGLLVSPGDTAELIRALDALVSSFELRHRMGVAGRRRVELRSAPEAYSQKLTSIMRRLALEGRRVPGHRAVRI
ncbi:MAG TPA: glycosyltransferase family 4 protein [Blastocatellia bacterium]|nr:glycosyltransferase family 4 protein [Blastocatellia bacterium]